jgi:ribosomal protein S18 acetylase RimI-like enzyme
MLTTRQATDVDLRFLSDVFLRAMQAHIAAARGYWDEEKERLQFHEQLRLRDTQIIVHDGIDVGFFMTTESGADTELHTICIAPEYQRRGIGSAITRQIISDARAQRRGVVLSVLKANTSARSLYERLGFAVSEESSHHYRMRGPE